MAVAYEHRLTIPQLDNAINVTKKQIHDLGDDADPRITEKLQVMIERFQKAKAKINRYYEKTVKKNPGIVVRRNQLRVVDTIKDSSKRQAALRDDIKNPSNSYNLLDHLEDKRGFYIAGLGTVGGIALLSSMETTLSVDALKALDLAGVAGKTQFGILEIAGAFLKQNPGIAVALCSTAAIAVLANMPKIRAAWNKSKVNKAAILDAENNIYDEANKLNSDQKLLQTIIEKKHDLNSVPNLKEDLADHPDLVERLVAVLSDTNDTSLPKSVKHHLLRYMVAHGLGTGLPDKNTYSPHHALLASKFAGLELSIAENEVHDLSEAKKARDEKMGKEEFRRVCIVNSAADDKKLETLYNMLHNSSDPNYCAPGTIGRSELEDLAAKIEAALSSKKTTALATTKTVGGSDKKISEHFTAYDLTSISASDANTQNDIKFLQEAKIQLDRGIDANLSYTIKSTDGTAQPILQNYLDTLIAYKAELGTAYFNDAKTAAKGSTKDALGISKVEKTEAAALDAIKNKLSITVPAKQAAKLAELENAYKAAEMGA